VAGVEEPNTLHGHAGADDSGVAGSELADAADVPELLVADTVKVYVVPLVKLLKVADVDVDVTVVPAVVPIYGVTV
jgi:hypothetical protein